MYVVLIYNLTDIKFDYCETKAALPLMIQGLMIIVREALISRAIKQYKTWAHKSLNFRNWDFNHDHFAFLIMCYFEYLNV